MARNETLVEAGSSVNEDLVWSDTEAVVVLDGATGLTERHFSDRDSDGQWYVEEFADEIADNIYSDDPLEEVVADVITTVDQRYESLRGDESIAAHELPSAAGVLCRWNRGSFEYFVLGDCSVVVGTDSGVEPILGEGPRRLDDKVVEEMVSIRQEEDDIGHEAVRERVRPMLVEHRKMKNSPDGYWALGLDPDAVEHATTGTISLADVETALAFTDGFEPLYALYDAVADWGNLLEFVHSNGLERAVRILRAFEASDPRCERYPRLKPSDDVGVAFVTDLERE